MPLLPVLACENCVSHICVGLMGCDQGDGSKGWGGGGMGPRDGLGEGCDQHCTRWGSCHVACDKRRQGFAFMQQGPLPQVDFALEDSSIEKCIL